jgi:phenylalanine-4-hydroxylase
MTFQIDNPYNPNENNVASLLQQKIFECLFLTANENYNVTIENGFYNPQQIAIELTNKFNEAVTNRITQYFIDKINNPDLSQEDIQLYEQALTSFNDNGGYTNFIIVYNLVGIKLWFGNISDSFILTNDVSFIKPISFIPLVVITSYKYLGAWKIVLTPGVS